MPFLLNKDTRNITEVTKLPFGTWMNINIACQKLINGHHDVEMGYVPAYGIRDVDTGDVIVQTRDMAYDIEYYYRGSDDIAYTPGSPNSVEFS